MKGLAPLGLTAGDDDAKPAVAFCGWGGRGWRGGRGGGSARSGCHVAATHRSPVSAPTRRLKHPLPSTCHSSLSSSESSRGVLGDVPDLGRLSVEVSDVRHHTEEQTGLTEKDALARAASSSTSMALSGCIPCGMVEGGKGSRRWGGVEMVVVWGQTGRVSSVSLYAPAGPTPRIHPKQRSNLQQADAHTLFVKIRGLVKSVTGVHGLQQG